MLALTNNGQYIGGTGHGVGTIDATKFNSIIIGCGHGGGGGPSSGGGRGGGGIEKYGYRANNRNN